MQSNFEHSKFPSGYGLFTLPFLGTVTPLGRYPKWASVGWLSSSLSVTHDTYLHEATIYMGENASPRRWFQSRPGKKWEAELGLGCGVEHSGGIVLAKAWSTLSFIGRCEYLSFYFIMSFDSLSQLYQSTYFSVFTMWFLYSWQLFNHSNSMR